MVLVFNKTDVQEADFAHDWMTDFEKFQEALREEEQKGVFGGEGFGGGSGYMSTLLNSMSMMLEEFYSHLNMVAVSSTTGEGVDEFFEAVEAKREEFNRDYKPELDRRRKQREAEKATSNEKDLTQVMKDLDMSALQSNPAAKDQLNDTEENEDEDDEKNDPDQYPDDVNEGTDEGLSSRYKAALEGSSVHCNSGAESFANYLASSQANRQP